MNPIFSDQEVAQRACPRREWALLLVLAGVQFTHIMDFMVMMPLGPQFLRLFAISPQQFGFLVAIYTFSAGISGLIAVFYIDRYDRKTLLLALYAGFILATLLCALAPGYELLLLARAAAGAFGGVLSATVFAILGDAIEPSRRGSATGLVMSAFSLAAVLGVPVGLYLAQHGNWRAPFLLVASLGLLLWITAFYTLPRLRTHLHIQRTRNAGQHLLHLVTQPNHLVAFALIATLMFAGFSVIPFISPYMVANVGLQESDLPYLYLSGGLASLFSARMIGRCADRYGHRKVFVAVAGISILPILVITHLPLASVGTAIAVMTVFMVFVSGRFVPTIALITASVEPGVRGSFMSLNSSVQQFAAGFASLLAGMTIGKNASGALIHYGWVGIGAALATMLCMVISGYLRPLTEHK